MSVNKFKAGDKFPDITLPLLGGEEEVPIGQPTGDNTWQMVVVYRGKHCPLCSKYLAQLEEIKDKFYEQEVGLIAVSGDPLVKAQDQAKNVGLTIPVAYGLSIEQMKQLGLYISEPRSPQETDQPFSEPGIFVVNDKGQVQVTDISNAPFSRPDLEHLASGLGFIRDSKNNYPIRGTFE